MSKHQENLNTAKNRNKDEFYTTYETIHNELKDYVGLLDNKIIYCNFDNDESSFYKYFKDNFYNFNINKVIATTLSDNAVKYEYDGKVETAEFLNGNGDFRSKECIDILEQSDVIITNPAFSLFRELYDILKKYNKKFILLGNTLSATYMNIFPDFKSGTTMFGKSITKGDVRFNVPSDYPLEANTCGTDDKGNRFIKVKGIRWITNIDNGLRHPFLITEYDYNDMDYERFDNLDNVICVNKTSEIPNDYYGEMGVPFTFLDKYNPEQFEILKSMTTSTVNDFSYGCPMVNGKKKFSRLVIRRRK